ncbi:MAG: hypothetical protein JWQ23_498 [Herminiimonas sp.]|jgi:hypothetical protein|nr:hypothetical protein [Herminiimonas sp.]
MKEFIEQLKQYKELVAMVASIIFFAFFIANYFATNSALEEAKAQIELLNAERECRLGNRITVAESNSAIAALEREQIEKMREKIEVQSTAARKANSIEETFARERLEKIAADLGRIDGDLKSLRSQSKQANEYLIRNACNTSAKQTGGER